MSPSEPPPVLSSVLRPVLPSGPSRYAVLVPVKPPAFAKSRLAAVGDDARRTLVVAFAIDTVSAVLESGAVSGVLAVTDDHVLAAGLSDAGAFVIPDAITDDLNGSLRQAALEARRRWPDSGVAALCADLPALRSADLERVMSAAPADRMSFVADADGVGTTTVLAPSIDLFAPRFGPESRKAHLESGAAEIELGDVPTLRHDVDTPADLVAALKLGVGGRTALAAAGLSL